MSAQHIHAWLQGRQVYADGLALLKRFGTPDDATLFLLELGETSVSRAQLTSALRDLHEEAVARNIALQERNATPPPVLRSDIIAERAQLARDPRNDGYEGQQLPTALQALRDQVKTDLREMSYLKSRLELLPSDDDRLRDALRIVALDEDITSAYARLDAWKATGRDPGEKEPPPPMNGIELVTRLRNIKSYLSRARSGKRKVSPAQLKGYEDEEKELTKLIDALQKG